MGATSNIAGIAPQRSPEHLPQPPSSAPEPRNEVATEAKEREQAPAPELTADELREVVQSFEEAIVFVNRSIRFQVDESTNRLVTLIVNQDTNEVIRQIPPEEMVAIARRLREFVGLFLDVEV